MHPFPFFSPSAKKVASVPPRIPQQQPAQQRYLSVDGRVLEGTVEAADSLFYLTAERFLRGNHHTM